MSFTTQTGETRLAILDGDIGTGWIGSLGNLAIGSQLQGVGTMIGAFVAWMLLASGHSDSSPAAEPASSRSAVTWVENGGQWPGECLFVARLGGSVIGAEPWAVLVERRDPDSGRGALVRLAFEGARPGIVPRGVEPQPGKHSFFFGSDPEAWHTGLRSFARVRYDELYPGIDLVLREGPSGLEYDLHLDPGADLSQVVVHCQGVEAVDRADDGSLELSTALGPLVQPVGKSFELLPDGTTRRLDVDYRLVDRERFGFEALSRDAALPLVVDPELLWSTYLGGSGGGATDDTPWAVAVGKDGNVTAATETSDWASFPLTPGAFQSTSGPGAVVVTRLDAGSGHLVYSSALGGKGNLRPQGIAVDGTGRAAVVGWTYSDDFPTTPGAFDPVKNSPPNRRAAFALRLSPGGDQLEFSTFLEASNGATASGVAMLDTGQVIVGGDANSGDFPVTPGAFQTTYGHASTGRDAFVSQLDPTGSTLEWSTFLGGSQAETVFAVAADAAGLVTVAGETGSQDFPVTQGAYDTSLAPFDGDAFVTRIAADGSSLVWSTFVGGSGFDGATALAVEPSGIAAIGGWTHSPDFPVTPNAFRAFTPPAIGGWGDGFATRVSADGTTLVASTCIGGTGAEGVVGLAADPSGIVTILCWARDIFTFPTTPGAFDPTPSNTDDLVVCRFDPAMTRLFYSTFLGGPLPDSAESMGMGPTRRVTAAGTSWGGYPTTPGAFSPSYNGGTNDAVLTTFDLVLEGIELVGRSIPACLGPIAMNATEMPVSGAGAFALHASAAPPNARGWLLVGDVPLWSLGHLQLGANHRAISVQADPLGYVEAPLPLTSFQQGEVFHARFIFRHTGDCSGQWAFSASNALRIEVQ